MSPLAFIGSTALSLIIVSASAFAEPPAAPAHCSEATDDDVLLKIAPPYPPLAKAAAVSATCQTTFDVDAAGLVHDICSVCALSEPGLNAYPASALEDLSAHFADATTSALREWRFQPGRASEGRNLRVCYTLRAAPPPPPAPAPALHCGQLIAALSERGVK